MKRTLPAWATIRVEGCTSFNMSRSAAHGVCTNPSTLKQQKQREKTKSGFLLFSSLAAVAATSARTQHHSPHSVGSIPPSTPAVPQQQHCRHRRHPPLAALPGCYGPVLTSAVPQPAPAPPGHAYSPAAAPKRIGAPAPQRCCCYQRTRQKEAVQAAAIAAVGVARVAKKMESCCTAPGLEAPTTHTHLASPRAIHERTLHRAPAAAAAAAAMRRYRVAPPLHGAIAV